MGKSASVPPEVIIGQCLVAFGQGTGQMAVSGPAVETLVSQYRPILTENAARWPVEYSRTLEFARALGRIAAQIALAARSTAIESGHVREAMSTARASGEAYSKVDCPFC